MHKWQFKNKRLILTLPLLLASSLLLPLHVVPSAHAATGLVCITASSTATSCDTSAPTISGLSVGQTFSVGVFVQGSDPTGGFDIFVASNPGLVAPVSAALGSLIVSPALTSICINGSAQTGTCTPNSANGPGVVEVTTLESSGGTDPGTNMAFTINYKVMAAFGSTSLSYPTNGGCSLSSVSSPANVCVLVSDNFGSPLSENTQGANLAAGLTGAFVCVTPTSSATACPVGAPNIPHTFGDVFSVGVFVQNSAPLNGFDIYVSADPNFLLPTTASVGSLITNPTSTNVCINGVSVQGACTQLTANGPGVVEVSTFEGTGSNDPGTGLAFSVTYQVVGVTPSTSLDYPQGPGCSPNSVSAPPHLPNTCVNVLDNLGNFLSVDIQPATVSQQHPIDPTSKIIVCSPGDILSPDAVGLQTPCIVTVTDTAATNTVAPIGKVTFSTEGFGAFAPLICVLQPINTFQSQCQVLYDPLVVGTGIHVIHASYPGDTVHSGSDPSFPLYVSPAVPIVSPFVQVDQTGGPVPPAGIPAGHGFTVHAGVVMNGGYTLSTGTGSATGHVTYNYYANGNCAGQGVTVGTVPIGVANNVPQSLSVTVGAVGSYSFKATYSPDTTDNSGVISCVAFLVNNFDFSISGPSTQFNVGPGLFNDTTVSVTGLNGFTGDVFFSPIGLPAGVTVQFVPNPATVATAGGSASTTMRVFVSAKVTHSFTFSVKGTWEGLINKLIPVTVTVVGAPPSILKVNWNHELSLSLDGSQVWHVFINNTETVPINVVFRIQGKSTTNPGNTFDIVCGTTCVNTARKGVNATPGLTPILVPALTAPKQIKISYTLASAFVNQNVKFTITIWITTATGTFYQPTNSFSGTFFVFP